MNTPSESLPTDLASAHAMILAERQARLVAEAAVAKAHTDRIVLDLELERLRFQLAKARRETFGQSSESGARIGQLELALTIAPSEVPIRRPPSTFTLPIEAARIRRRSCEHGPASCRRMPTRASTGCTDRSDHLG